VAAAEALKICAMIAHKMHNKLYSEKSKFFRVQKPRKAVQAGILPVLNI
jgi:hypothetical protein